MSENRPDAPLPEEDNSQTADAALEWLRDDNRRISRRLKLPRIHNPFKNLDLPPSENSLKKTLPKIARRPFVIVGGITIAGGGLLIGVTRLAAYLEYKDSQPDKADPTFEASQAGHILTLDEVNNKDFSPSQLQNMPLTIPHVTAKKRDKNFPVLFKQHDIFGNSDAAYTAIMYTITDVESGEEFPLSVCIKAFSTPATNPPIPIDIRSQKSEYLDVSLHGTIQKNEDTTTTQQTGDWLFVIDGFVPSLK